MWQSLLANLAVMAMVLVGWNALAQSASRFGSTVRNTAFGAAMAIGTLASMAMAFEFAPGVLFDLRNTLIVVSGLFGGLPAALMTAGVALAYRIWLGGAISHAALGILLSVAIGLGMRRAGRRYATSIWSVGASASASALFTAAILATLSADWRITPGDIAGIILISFMATMFLGSVLLWEDEKRRLANVGRQLRSMVDALPDCLNIKDLDGRFLVANPATAALMNAPDAEALTGKSDFDFYPPDIAQRFRADELAVLESGVATTIEQEGRKPDGSPAWLSTLKAPAFDAEGNLVGLVTSNRDITERKALLDKLAETQTYLDLALKNMNDGLAIYNPQGVLLFSNDRYRALFPATANLRVPGTPFATIVAASIDAGEEILPEGSTVAEHTKNRLEHLFKDGEYIIRKPEGAIYASRTKVLDNGDALRIIADVTERSNHERTLERQALHDPLTGVPNRAYYDRQIERMLARAGDTGDEVIVMLLDLDRFKQVNDSFGHAAGDALLVEVSRRLVGIARHGDFVARLGGDEFAILAIGRTEGAGDVSLATRIVKALGKPMAFGDVTLIPSGTIGYTVWPQDPSDAEGLMRNADKALYQAKARGRGGWKRFEPDTMPGELGALAS